MAVRSLCLNPDWGNRRRGLFVPNPVAGHTNRFWHNDETEETRSPSRPPAPRRVGISAPAVPDQVVVAIREDARYTIENIMVDCSARGSGAGQASPFRNAAGDLVCTFSRPPDATGVLLRSEEHTSELQSRENLVCRLLLEKKKYKLNQAAELWRHNIVTYD